MVTGGRILALTATNPIELTYAAILSIIPPTTGSVGHYKTKALGIGLAAVLLVGVSAFYFRKRLIEKIRTSIGFRIAILILSPLMAVGLSAIASWEDLFKPSTYEVTAGAQPDWHTLLWVFVWSACSAITIAASALVFTFKEGEELKSTLLERSLENERVARASVERQRELLADITNFVMGIVKTKRDRLLSLIGNHVTAAQFFEAINPNQQIVLLVQVMHEFFMPDHPDRDFILRLGIFVRDEKDPQQLTAIHCWDGAKPTMFEGRNPEHLQLDNPFGHRSAIVRCFHSTDGCIIIPNSFETNGPNVDSHLVPIGRDKEVASIVAYKHMYRNARNQDDAMMVMLMASKVDYFKQEEKAEIRQFLDEILTRLELEWMISETVAKLTAPAKEANEPANT